MASYNLEDGAQMWYMQVQSDEGTPSWTRFKELLNLRYGPPLRSAPLFELVSCRRTGTVVRALPSVPAPRRPPRRGATGPAVHGRPASPAQPRRPSTEPAIPRRCHESCTTVRAHGAVHRRSGQGSSPGRVDDAGAAPCSAPTASAQGWGAHRHRRGPAGETAQLGEARRTMPPRSMLQL